MSGEAVTGARAARDAAIAEAEDGLLALIEQAVDDGQVTIGAAAQVIGRSRAPLSRALNARAHERRAGGGRHGDPDAGTLEALRTAARARAAAEQTAVATFLDAIEAEIAEGVVTIAAAAEILEMHRGTLGRHLAARARERRESA